MKSFTLRLRKESLLTIVLFCLSTAGTLVFCEVKTRRGSAFGGPFEAVGWKKQRKLRQLAQAFLAASGLEPDGTTM